MGNDSQHGQTWLFYLNTITGLMYMPLAIMLLMPGYKLWFWSFHFKQAPFERRSPVEFLNNNIACMIAGLSCASLIAPNNPGVGIVGFWVHLLLFFVFLAVVAGQHGEVNNKPIWIFWMVNCVLFCVLLPSPLSAPTTATPTTPPAAPLPTGPSSRGRPTATLASPTPAVSPTDQARCGSVGWPRGCCHGSFVLLLPFLCD